MTTLPYLFGLDLDGTLLGARGVLSDRTRDAVHALLAAGHHVCFSTGRNLYEAREVFDAVRHEHYVVLVSGAMVVDLRDNSVLHRGHMDAQLAADLCAAIESTGEAAIAFQDRSETDVDYLISAGRPVHPSQAAWLEISGQRVGRPPVMAEIDHTRTLRVSCVCGYESAARVRSLVAERFADRVYVHSIVIAPEKAEIVELFDPRVNKWQGLVRVADLFGVPHDRIIAVGDDTNDLPMIRNAKLGVAMGNARAEVKMVADRIIGRNDADGLAVFLEEWLRTAV